MVVPKARLWMMMAFGIVISVILMFVLIVPNDLFVLFSSNLTYLYFIASFQSINKLSMV
jgi:hypothetical protein